MFKRKIITTFSVFLLLFVFHTFAYKTLAQSQCTQWSSPPLTYTSAGAPSTTEAIQSLDDIVIGNTITQGVWQGDKGYVRTVPIVNGNPDWNNGSAWSAPLDINILPGPAGSHIQTSNSFVIGNGSTLMQGIWRGDQGFTRTVPIVNGNPDWSSCPPFNNPTPTTIVNSFTKIAPANNTIVPFGPTTFSWTRPSDSIYNQYIIEFYDEHNLARVYVDYVTNIATTSKTINLSTVSTTFTPGTFYQWQVFASNGGNSQIIADNNSNWAFQIAPPACVKKVQGDANCDGHVNMVDYSIWLNHQCNSGCAAANLVADFNGDGKVNDTDYTTWSNNSE